LSDSVLILDEPTAPLGRAEITRLFDVMRTVAAQGTGIVLITHHLAEVFAVSDQVMCLREGRVVMSTETQRTTMSELIETMLGRATLASRRGGAGAAKGLGSAEANRDVALKVEHLSVGEKLVDVSFSVARGEILGVAGLAGSGRSTLLKTLFGDIKPTGGTVELHGEPYRPRSPRQAIARGVYLTPEDRAIHGLVLIKPIGENIVLPILQRFVNRLHLLEMSKGRVVAHDIAARLDVRSRGIDQIIGELSGGNQQKVVLAKSLATEAHLLLLDEPTFGVDIGAASEIIQHVRSMADRGTGVIWATSDLRELLEVADRVMVIRDGMVDLSIRRGEPDFEEEVIIARMQRTQYLDVASAEMSVS
jgi:ABC-type sugar transport system ATPase subunit